MKIKNKLLSTLLINSAIITASFAMENEDRYSSSSSSIGTQQTTSNIALTQAPDPQHSDHPGNQLTLLDEIKIIAYNMGMWFHSNNSAVSSSADYSQAPQITSKPLYQPPHIDEKFIKDHITGSLQDYIREAYHQGKIDSQFVKNLGGINFKNQPSRFSEYFIPKHITYILQSSVRDLFDNGNISIKQLLTLGTTDFKLQPSIFSQMFPNQ